MTSGSQVAGGRVNGEATAIAVWSRAAALKLAPRCADSGPVFELEAALRHLVESGGSDLHLKVPSRPMMRINGRLEPLPGSEPLEPQVTQEIVEGLLTSDALIAEAPKDDHHDHGKNAGADEMY